MDPATLVTQLTSRAELASALPPYETVVGLAHAQQILTAALTSRMTPVATASKRELLIGELVAAITHQRALVHSTTTVFGCELQAAGHRVDAALAALAACPSHPNPQKRRPSGA